MGLRSGKVLEGLDFGGIQPHALGTEHCAREGNLRLPVLTLSTVEDNAKLTGCLHQLQEVSVMHLRGMAIDTYIIMNGEYAR